jgi:single-strand DNA-binding protein
MWNINRVVEVGRLSRDVELKYTPDNKAVAKFGIAVGGMKKDEVSFFEVVVWGKVAENCANYLSKGKKVAIDGRLNQRSWTTQEGQKRSVIEIIADRVEFLESGNKQEPGSMPDINPEDGNYTDNF